MNLTETYLQAQHLASSFSRPEVKHVELRGIEIGNEVDGFRVTPYTNLTFSNWTPFNYTDTWFKFASNLSETLDLGSGGGNCSDTGLQVGSFMSSGNSQPWNPLNVIGTGVLDTVKGIKWWSDHFYTGVYGMGNPPSPGSLMGKGTVRGILSQRIVDISTARRSGLKFIVVSPKQRLFRSFRDVLRLPGADADLECRAKPTHMPSEYLLYPVQSLSPLGYPGADRPVSGRELTHLKPWSTRSEQYRRSSSLGSRLHAPSSYTRYISRSFP